MHLEEFKNYLLNRPIKATSVPSYVASIRAVEKALGKGVDNLLATGKSKLIDKVQESNPSFAGKSKKDLSNYRTSVRRYAEATGVS